MRRIILCIVFIASIILSACVDDREDLEDYVQQVKSTAKEKVDPLPAQTAIKQFTYTAQSMRSPFVLAGGSYTEGPTQVAGKDGKPVKQEPRPDLDRPREYLEQFPLSTFTMVGTLSKPDTNWGLIKDTKGMIYAVKIGDYIGLNSGVIVGITPDQIRINETVPNGAGGWMQSRAVLNLTIAKPQTETTKPATTKGTAKTATPAQAPVPNTEQVNDASMGFVNQPNQQTNQQKTSSGTSSSGTGMGGGY